MPEPALKLPQTQMRHAMALAEKALPIDVPVGAFIMNAQGEILAEAYNRREKDSDATAHAEILAIRQAGESLQSWRLSDLTLIVTLEPCPMCAAAICQARIQTVIFGAADPIQGAFGSALNLTPYYQPAPNILGGILQEDCQKQLQQFFKARR